MRITQVGLSFIALCCFITAAAQKPGYRIYAVQFAHSGYPFTADIWAAGGSKTQRVDIAFSVWLIKSHSRTILMDAGFHNDIEDAKDFQFTTYIRPDSALQRMGIRADEVTDVIISHPHWDHIDGVDLFPKAHFWMQKEDYNYFMGNLWQAPQHSGGFAKRDAKKILDLNLAGRLTLIDGDNKEIIPGIRVYTGSRHTYASQYALVRTGKQQVVLASDNVWIYANLQHLLPATSGGTLDPAAYIRAMKRMKTMVTNPKFIIPGHDGQVCRRFPATSESVVEIK